MTTLKNQKGFSLIEIMIAIGLFAATALVIINGVLFSSNIKIRDQNLLRATFLANNKMVEIESEFYENLARGLFPDDKKETGVFENQDSDFSWTYEIRRVEIPLPSSNEKNAMSLSIIKRVLDEISKSVRELTVYVNWVEDEDKEDPEEIKLTTHVVKLP